MELLKCKICGIERRSLVTHLTKVHKITGKQYKELYGDCKLILVSDETKLKLSKSNKRWCSSEENRKKLSERAKNGGSIFTVNYWIKRGYSLEDAKCKISEIQIENAKKSTDSFDKSRSCFCVDYWVNKGFSIEESKTEVSKLQKELTKRSSKFKGKIRTDESKMKISKSMTEHINSVGASEWSSHFGDFNGSSILEDSVFDFVNGKFPGVKRHVDISHYVVDILIDNIIIEVNGDLWHANPIKYLENDIINESILNITAGERWEREKNRTNILESLGYIVYVIWEHDWKNNRKNEENKVIKFLYENNSKNCK